ncbi:J domain-containing protein [Vibrio sp. SS-MA-C1-2]|uniref:J domain-containing protein n=1 Tax=Vibrio sp. SS-MA-C1-2 TaxID=2908646 RepID=UPI001F16A871|nr:DnaJ domain-containing protein [Vibrio sp. SS-MA-C1-2]UJF17000.1 J domain-containing protein [Vibrio sp. SS-MA-C1-2]
MIERTYYDVLGISPSSSINEIRKSYKNIVRQNTKTPSSITLEELNEATLAYKVLSSSHSKYDYDLDIFNRNALIGKADIENTLLQSLLPVLLAPISLIAVCFIGLGLY